MAEGLGALAGWRGEGGEELREEHVNDGDSDVDVPEEVTMLLSMLGNEHEAYWGCRYEKELAAVRAAIASDSPDPLESLFVWFGKMAMLMACQTISSDELALQPDRSVVLDLGCGNGFTCEVLHAMGFKRVIGSDYSSKAISLALAVQEHFKTKASAEAQGSWGTKYVVDDILRTRIPPQSIDLIHDSGTLDSIAMTLSDPAAPFDPFAPPASVASMRPAPTGQEAAVAAEQEGRGQESGLLCDESDGVLLVDKEHALCGSGIQGYLSNVCALLRPKGYLLLRTCNHSAQEIKSLLASSPTALHFVRDVTEDGNASGVLTLLLQKQPQSSAAPSA